jgi:hypothetical protein
VTGLLRARVVVCLLLAIGAQVAGSFFVEWYRVWASDKVFTIIGSFASSHSSGAPDLRIGGAYLSVSGLVQLTTSLLSLGLVVVLFRVVVGEPANPNGRRLSARSVRIVILLALAAAVACWFLRPELSVAHGHWFIERPLRRSAINGNTILILGLVLGELAVYMITRDRDLAATQGWTAAIDSPRLAKAGLRERRMIKRGLPEAPRVETDPFRAPPASELDAKIVKPPIDEAAPRAEDPSAPPPKLLG